MTEVEADTPSPRLRGEGRGEGLRRSSLVGAAPHPALRATFSPQSPGRARGGRRDGLLNGGRRYFAALALLLIATPLVVGLVAPDSPATVLKEGRRLAPAPGVPWSGADWRALPAKVDAYLKDHFGLRQVLIRAHTELTKPLLGPGSDAVLIGRDGRMFYLGEEAVRQSAGLVLRDERVADTVDLIAAMNDDLERRGIRFLVAVPPNAATVYQDDLPDWAKNQGRRTEYDLLLKGLAARGVKAIDLRPAMAEARWEGPAYFRHDSHWTARGALTAYNAVVEADGRSAWRLDPATALAAPSPHRGGDLARLIGVQDGVTEEAGDLKLPQGEKTLLTPDPYGDYVQTSGRAGPTVMIIGDSFTAAHFEPMALQHAGRVVWLDHRHCRFDWAAIDRFRPDEVWWTPTERFLVCDPGARPLGFKG
jgi:alginate O-acetyltransferase complex protein AlgJ